MATPQQRERLVAAVASLRGSPRSSEPRFRTAVAAGHTRARQTCLAEAVRHPQRLARSRVGDARCRRVEGTTCVAASSRRPATDEREPRRTVHRLLRPLDLLRRLAHPILLSVSRPAAAGGTCDARRARGSVRTQAAHRNTTKPSGRPLGSGKEKYPPSSALRRRSMKLGRPERTFVFHIHELN